MIPALHFVGGEGWGEEGYNLLSKHTNKALNMKTTSLYQQVLHDLHTQANPKKAATQKTFFKHCKNDIFLGVPIPTIRLVAKKFLSLDFPAIKKLMFSIVHEERSLAHAILVLRFKKADLLTQEKIYLFYLNK